MKKILIGALMVITSYGAQSQNLWKAPLLPEEHIEVSVSEKPTEDEIKMSEEVLDTIPQHRVGPPHFGHPASPMVRMPLLPKPQQIIDKGDKVILIFTKSDWAKYERIKRWHYLRNRRQLEIGKEWPKRPEHNSMQRDYMERKPNFNK